MNEIFHRTSIRKYLDKPVEAEKVETMLKAAMAAPSAGNQQPWEFYVVSDAGTLEKLAKTSPYAGGSGCTEYARKPESICNHPMRLPGSYPSTAGPL